MEPYRILTNKETEEIRNPNPVSAKEIRWSMGNLLWKGFVK